MFGRYFAAFKGYVQRNWQWLLAGIVLGVILFIVTIVMGYFSGIANAVQMPKTSILTIVPIPTETALEPTEQVLETLMPTASPTSPPMPGENIEIGELVVVSGTDGDQLRFRTQPGLSNPVGFLAYENEVFLVEGGPADEDGYVWWFLVNPYDSSKSGWAVQNYLRLMENP